jgi:hypothetical protein
MTGYEVISRASPFLQATTTRAKEPYFQPQLMGVTLFNSTRAGAEI